MVIAVTKATLVVLFFMHLRYDRLFHSVIFVSAILAACLFVGFTLMDTGQYQHTNIWNPTAPPPAPVGPRPTP
jgi:cytochrome c oxidase subunit 4